MKQVLEIIKNEMDALGLNYYYLTNNASKVIYPYITGEYSESDYVYEDGSTEAEMLLEAWMRGSNLELVKVNELIKEKFKNYSKSLDGFSVRISYAGCYPRRTNDEGLAKLEIHLDIKYWEGD